MPDTSLHEAFERHLDLTWASYHQDGDTVVIENDLLIKNDDLTCIPDDVRVLGKMHIHDSRIPVLPQRLTVLGEVIIYNVPLLVLPPCFRAGGDLWLKRTRITTLPPDLTVHGMLDLWWSPIEALPEGLDVAGDLNLQATKIVSFPHDMRVGGWIGVPDDLIETEVFGNRMQVDEILYLPFPSSAHLLMDARTRLDGFPDLWRIFRSMPAQHRMVIRRTSRDITIGFEDMSYAPT